MTIFLVWLLAASLLLLYTPNLTFDTFLCFTLYTYIHFMSPPTLHLTLHTPLYTLHPFPQQLFTYFTLWIFFLRVFPTFHFRLHFTLFFHFMPPHFTLYTFVTITSSPLYTPDLTLHFFTSRLSYFTLQTSLYTFFSFTSSATLHFRPHFFFLLTSHTLLYTSLAPFPNFTLYTTANRASGFVVWLI
jgi:hypothetical protein